jgi:AAA family ATP:ADP antiporter
VFGVLRRAGEYALSKPARETLFNVLPPEQKYKAKNVIDTLVHRTGDTASGWIFAGLRGLGLSGVHISWLSVPVAAGWVAIAWSLGRRAEAMQAQDARA